ncbi:MAG: AmmeMemoRadiSam system radical SAM enzyme [Chloroflexi bacterium]|nr:AmmeMemoRadiSam system radical SAM enzyme [Chloroflexota bacterium]
MVVAEREAMLYERLENSLVHCHVCQWRCIIRPGNLGVCRMRQNRDGVLNVLNYGFASSIAVDPIEKKPLYHFFPGTRVYSLGTLGCNFHCIDCQNWQIACTDFGERDLQQFTASQAVSDTRDHGCRGIAWTYNEPAIWFEYTYECARLAKKENLYTVYVTNGFMTPEALDTIGPYLDAYRVDIKGFSDDFYRKLAKIPRWRGILEVAERALKRWDMHLEVVTNVVPTMNDDEEQLTGIARWVREGLGELTPWHVTRFYPNYRLLNVPPTPVITLEKACDIGHKAGLRFVYVGNVPGHESDNTICYNCGRMIVERRGYRANLIGMRDSRCGYCGAEINFKTESWQRHPAIS